jgi:hypothetical protein
MRILGAPDHKKTSQRLTIYFVTLPQSILLKFSYYKGCHSTVRRSTSCLPLDLSALHDSSMFFIFYFQPSKTYSSKPRTVSSVLRLSMCSFVCNLPYCVFPSINALSSTPSDLCLTLSALSSLPILQILQPLFSEMVFEESTHHYFRSLSSRKCGDFIMMDRVLLDDRSQDLVDSCWSVRQRLQFSKQKRPADGINGAEIFISSVC